MLKVNMSLKFFVLSWVKVKQVELSSSMSSVFLLWITQALGSKKRIQNYTYTNLHKEHKKRLQNQFKEQEFPSLNLLGSFVETVKTLE